MSTPPPEMLLSKDFENQTNGWMGDVIIKCAPTLHYKDIQNKITLREGFKKKGKSMVFYQTPLGPPTPGYGLFSGTKIDPHFLVENCIFNGRKEFYAWSHFKKTKTKSAVLPTSLMSFLPITQRGFKNSRKKRPFQQALPTKASEPPPPPQQAFGIFNYFFFAQY